MKLKMISIVAATSIVLGACSNAGSGSGKEPSNTVKDSAKKGKVELRVGVAFDPTRLELYQKVANNWNETHPDVQVKLENTPWEQYWQKLQAMTVSKSMPDVWNYVPGFGTYWMTSNQLLPIDDYIKQDPNINIQDFQPTMLNYMTYKGKLYGLPYDYNGYVLFYNKDLFDQARVEYPKENWTFDNMKAAAEKIAANAKSDKGKVFGLALASGFTSWPIDGIYRSFGASLINDQGKVEVNNPGGIAMLKYFSDLVKSGVSPKPEAGQSLQNTWTNGLIGMYIDSGQRIADFMKSATSFKWDIERTPAGPKGQVGTGLGGTFVINKDTKYPKESYEFLAYLTNTENLKTLVANPQAGIPARKSAEAGLPAVMQKYAGILANYKWLNAVPGAFDVFEINSKESEQVFLSTKSPEEAVKVIETSGNKVLEEKAK
jgi:multiple sugar transport system substrate-binding protein